MRLVAWKSCPDTSPWLLPGLPSPTVPFSHLILGVKAEDAADLREPALPTPSA